MSRTPLFGREPSVPNAGLYFHPDEAPALRRRFESAPHRAARWQRLLRNADGLLRQPVAGGTYDIGLTRSALGNAGISAFAFALTGKKPYADRALLEANALLAQPRWTKPTPNSRGAYLATGEASMACALVYDWCRTAMSDTDRAAYRDRMFTLGVRPYLDSVGPFKDWWRDNDVTNWTGVVNGGCGLAALVLYDDIPEAKMAADFAWNRIVTFLRTANRADGGGDEGVMYYTYGMLFAYYFAVAAARRFGDDHGLFRDAVDKMCGYYLDALQGPDGRYANFNDMNEDTFDYLPPKDQEGGPNATLCSLWDAKTPGGDRLLAWAADNGGDNYYWRDASPFSLLFRGDSPPVRTRPAVQKSILFRQSGQAIWNAAPGMWFAFSGGWTSDRSHYNLDLGSFVLIANGERLIWDPGYGKKMTADHSTLLINGQEQVTNVSGTYRAWAEGPGWRYLACDLSTVYGKKSPLTRWVRHAVLIEDGPYAAAPLLVLFDDMAASAPCDWETRLQIKSDPSIAGPSAFIAGAKANLSVIWAAPDSVTPEVGQGKGASTHLWARLTGRPAARLATALYSTPAGTSKIESALGVEGKPDGGAVVTVGPKGRERRLTFVPTGDGGVQLAAVGDRAVTNSPGPEKRSLRRV